MRKNHPDQKNVLGIFIATSLAVVFAFFFINDNIWFPQSQAIAANSNSNGSGSCGGTGVGSTNSNGGCTTAGFDTPDTSMKDFRED